jgi:hypothetical protein
MFTAMQHSQLARAIDHIKNTLNISDRQFSSLSKEDMLHMIHAAIVEMGEDCIIPFNVNKEK